MSKEKLFQAFFAEQQPACWLLDHDFCLLTANQPATVLAQRYEFRLQQVLDVAFGAGCALHPTMTDCQECPLDKQWSTDCFPVNLLGRGGLDVEPFTGGLQQFSFGWSLSLTAVSTEILPPDLTMLHYLQDARENERKRIAGDLHDGLAQSVYSLMLETRGLKWRAPEQIGQALQAIDSHFVEVLEEIKVLATELRPAVIDDLGLLAALGQFVEQTAEMTGFIIQLQVPKQLPSLTAAQEIVIYRIIQEATANALKYSGENMAELVLTYQQPILQVSFSDQGTGFDPAVQAKGLGLLNMQERGHSIRGQVTVDSQPGKGTTICLVLPLEEVAS